MLPLVAILLAACSADRGLAPDPTPPDLGRGRDAPPGLTVLSRNMYVGADVDVVIGALASPDPDDDVPALLSAIATLQETDYTARVRAFADEIARSTPHVIGLQEVSTIDIDLGPLGLPLTVREDFLPELLAALAARGLDYHAAASVTNIQANPLPGISLVDRDVLLVRRGAVEILGPATSRTYATNIGPVAPGVVLQRGWVAVPVRVNGQRYLVANTHLESGSAPGFDLLRAAQAAELVATLVGEGPAVVLGDLNDAPGSPMYQVLAAAGFGDAWAMARPTQPGLTCCHAADLANREPGMTQRLDYVLLRGAELRGRGADDVRLVGIRPAEKVDGPAHQLWASDHAGVVAEIRRAR